MLIKYTGNVWLQTLFHAPVSMICGGKHGLKTPNKVAGRVGKERVLGWINRCRNVGKNAKKT